MKTVYCGIVLALIIVQTIASPIQVQFDDSIECETGMEIKDMIQLKTTQCEPNQICSLAHVTASFMGSESTVTVGQCMEKVFCRAMTCAEVEAPLASMNMEVKGCNLECCLDKDCHRKVTDADLTPDEMILMKQTKLGREFAEHK